MYDKFYFIDFDGTIINQDSLDLLFENFSDNKWKIYDKKWERFEIGSLENLTYAFSTFDLTRNKLDYIIDKLEIDKSFYNFLTNIHKNNFGYMIISEGIDYIIRKTLFKNIPKNFNKHILNNLNICSNKYHKNKIIFSNNSQHCCYLEECKICSNCKYLITKEILSKEKIYIGDGLSDRFGILNCNIIYAKKKLLTHCKKYNIEHKYFNTFEDIKFS